MAYSPVTDLLALLRQTSGGGRMESIPGLDYVVAALARMGLFTVAVSPTAPTLSQATTVWFKPYVGGSWAAEGTAYLWNSATGQYEIATPALWVTLLSITTNQVTQDVISAGPVAVLTNAGIVRVMNVGAAVTLTLPPAASKVGSVLISDWLNAAGTNNITINTSGGDALPNGLTSWTIAGDGGSIFLRPVTGGYVL